MKEQITIIDCTSATKPATIAYYGRFFVHIPTELARDSASPLKKRYGSNPV